MNGGFYCQGRWVDEEVLDELRNWLKSHEGWSRKRLARGLCERWDWRNQRGVLKDFAGRSFLQKLYERGLIDLPAVRSYRWRQPRGVVHWPEFRRPELMEESLDELRPLKLRVVEKPEQGRRWGFYLQEFHYLGLRVVGENMRYLVEDARGRDVGCFLFGAAAWRCQSRDRYLGWDETQRCEHLHRIANNTRFLILPWVRVEHLASHLLGLVCRRIVSDWNQRYGHGLDWLETFVDRSRFRGTCYRAANWHCVGKTQGRTRQDPRHRIVVPVKAVYLYGLSS